MRDLRSRFGIASPLTLVVAVLFAVAPGSGAGSPGVAGALIPVLLAYACGAHAPTKAGLAATVALVIAMQLQMGFAEFPNVEIAIVTLPPWWAGVQVRRRRRLVEALAARTRELEAEEDAFIELSVRRERARISRDLHDIVSHHLAVMTIQAAAGRFAEPHDPVVAAARFEAIRDAGEQALVETDRLVALLEPDENVAPSLSALLDRAQRNGFSVRRPPADLGLPREIEAIAYRVVQEALTNVMKHAPRAAVDVRVEAHDDELAITVCNGQAEPSAIAQTGSGIGLASMRQRLDAVDGTLDAGPSSAGGFRFHARVPLRHGAVGDEHVSRPAVPASTSPASP
jgi:signal transduction histidine kinase